MGILSVCSQSGIWSGTLRSNNALSPTQWRSVPRHFRQETSSCRTNGKKLLRRKTSKVCKMSIKGLIQILDGSVVTIQEGTCEQEVPISKPQAEKFDMANRNWILLSNHPTQEQLDDMSFTKWWRVRARTVLKTTWYRGVSLCYGQCNTILFTVRQLERLSIYHILNFEKYAWPHGHALR